MIEAQATGRRWIDRIQILLFVAAIAAPSSYALRSGRTSVPTHENRSPAEWPDRATARRQPRQIPAKLEAWFDDRLGFRSDLLHFQSYGKWELFGLSSAPNVLAGKGGWLFLREPSRLDTVPERRPDQNALAKVWHDSLLKRQKWLEERGILYLVVVPPDKQSIYPERFPGDRRYLLDDPIADRLLGQSEVSGLNLIDLRTGVRAGRGTPDLYMIQDSHWHDIGAFHASKPIFDRIREVHPEVRPLSADDFATTPSWTETPWDLCSLVGGRKLPEDYYWSMRRKRPAKVDLEPFDMGAEDDVRLTHLKAQKSICASSNGPKVVVLHDSFGPMLLDLWRESFREILSVPTYALPKRLIEKEKPRIVIQEIVERQLRRPGEQVLIGQE